MAKSKRSSGAASAAGSIGEFSAAALKRARELLTAAERRIFDASHGPTLAKASHGDVTITARQARGLRDKWQGLASGQQRTNKRRAASRTDVAAGRSRDKLDLFHGVVARLERRLAELSATITAKPAAPKVRLKVDAGQKGRGKKIVTRAARRTAAKPALPARPAKAAPATVESALRAVVAAANPPAPAVRPAADERKVSKKVRNAGLRAGLGLQAGNQAIRFDKARQRSAVTAAKARRLAVEGLDTRRSGHAAARVRIKQAKRDQRGR